MAEKKETEKQTVVINGEEHNVADLSQEQVAQLNHVADLENKMRQTQFSLEQLDGARGYFLGQLTASLTAEPLEKSAS
jgi:uncharacterized iron-regulated protein